jgi:excisionase family DNA binding protein
MAQGGETVTAQEAAAMLGVSRATVTRLVQRGDLEYLDVSPVLRRPRHALLSRAAVAEYLEKQAGKRPKRAAERE